MRAFMILGVSANTDIHLHSLEHVHLKYKAFMPAVCTTPPYSDRTAIGDLW
jgi:hypothetical protein